MQWVKGALVYVRWKLAVIPFCIVMVVFLNESVTLCELDLAAPKLCYREILTKSRTPPVESEQLSLLKEDMVLRPWMLYLL